MSAAMRNHEMTVEDRVTGIEMRVGAIETRVAVIETDVGHLKTDVSDLKVYVGKVVDTLTDFRTEFQEFKVDVAKEFGGIRAALEKNKLWMLMIAFGAVIVPIVTALAHALKWF